MSETTVQPDSARMIDWDDANFTPEEKFYGDRDPLRMFRMGAAWPDKPFSDRKFQLGGKERICFLAENVFVFYGHRFNQRFMNSAVNGVRRCTKEVRGSCVACDHYDEAPTELKEGKNVKKARCGPRQQQFATNIIVYKTDLEGILLDEHNNKVNLTAEGPVVHELSPAGQAAGIAVGSPADLVYEVFLWRFSADKFTAVRTIKQQWQSLLNNDMICTLAPGKPEQFQDFEPAILPNSAWRVWGSRDRTKAEAFVAYYRDNSYDVSSIFGKEYSDEEMAGFLGTGEAAAPAIAVASQPVAEVAAQIEAAIGGASAVPTPSPPPTPPAPPAPTAPPAPPSPPVPTPPTPPAPPAPTPPAGDISPNFDELLKA